MKTQGGNLLIQRRTLLRLCLGLLPASLWGRRAQAQLPREPISPALAEIIRRETGGLMPTESTRITLDAPEVAEDGAIVPITVTSSLPEVREWLIFAEKNPVPLIARFQLEENLDPWLSLRIKLNETGQVVVVARSENGYFSARKNVKVVVGGCG
jgi:sulfur-oxidizing protein SoxY